VVLILPLWRGASNRSRPRHSGLVNKRRKDKGEAVCDQLSALQYLESNKR